MVRQERLAVAVEEQRLVLLGEDAGAPGLDRQRLRLGLASLREVGGDERDGPGAGLRRIAVEEGDDLGRARPLGNRGLAAFPEEGETRPVGAAIEEGERFVEGAVRAPKVVPFDDVGTDRARAARGRPRRVPVALPHLAQGLRQDLCLARGLGRGQRGAGEEDEDDGEKAGEGRGNTWGASHGADPSFVAGTGNTQTWQCRAAWIVSAAIAPGSWGCPAGTRKDAHVQGFDSGTGHPVPQRGA